MACPGFTITPRVESISDVKACEYATLADQLGLTDFNPLTVDWEKPVPWGNNASICNMDTSDGCLMPLGAGFGIVLGFGVFFSIFTTILVKLEQVFGGVQLTSEHFNTAGRDVKTGLTAAVIVSQWTWAATLLQSSNVAWQYGVSGPFWYAAGASIQVLLFGVLAIELKRKAPTCHTFLELVYVRWGKVAHLTFIFFAFCTNILVTMMLILGGADCMNATSGMDVVLAGFLIPIGVIWYTMVGGLKATFLASYLHTAIIFFGLVMFVTMTYVINNCTCTDEECEQCNQIGSASVMYERLAFISSLPMSTVFGANHGPAARDSNGDTDNRGGSYLTMMSLSGLKFGIINVVGNFGTVFVDQSYWQSAIAASPASSHKGYLAGGLVWFTIPFALATSLGLAGNALNVELTGGMAGRGLVPPASAAVMGGRGMGIFMIIMLFMAITSTGSAECIAVSSLVAYDIYRQYIKPQCTGKDIIFVSRVVIVVYGLLQGCLSAILLEIGIGIGWVYNFMGIIIGSAVIPVSYLVLWKDASAMGAMAGAWSGMIGAIIAWCVTASAEAEKNGFPANELSKETTGILEAQLAGNVTAICLSGLVCTVVSLIGPQNFDWKLFAQKITLVEEQTVDVPAWENSEEFLLKARQWIMYRGGGYTFVLIIVWPLATMPWGVFPKAVYNLWAALAFMWGWTAAAWIIIWPIYENATTFKAVLTCTPKPKSGASDKSVEVTSTTQA